MAQAGPWREALRERVGRCEWCGRHNHGLAVHEVLRGSGLRQKAMDKPYAVLVLCNDCHELMSGRDWAEQLAILRRSRPADYRLSDFHALAARVKPDHADVTLWLLRLSFVSEQ